MHHYERQHQEPRTRALSLVSMLRLIFGFEVELTTQNEKMLTHCLVLHFRPAVLSVFGELDDTKGWRVKEMLCNNRIYYISTSRNMVRVQQKPCTHARNIMLCEGRGWLGGRRRREEQKNRSAPREKAFVFVQHAKCAGLLLLLLRITCVRWHCTALLLSSTHTELGSPRGTGRRRVQRRGAVML